MWCVFPRASRNKQLENIRDFFTPPAHATWPLSYSSILSLSFARGRQVTQYNISRRQITSCAAAHAYIAIFELGLSWPLFWPHRDGPKFRDICNGSRVIALTTKQTLHRTIAPSLRYAALRGWKKLMVPSSEKPRDTSYYQEMSRGVFGGGACAWLLIFNVKQIIMLNVKHFWKCTPKIYPPPSDFYKYATGNVATLYEQTRGRALKSVIANGNLLPGVE